MILVGVATKLPAEGFKKTLCHSKSVLAAAIGSKVLMFAERLGQRLPIAPLKGIGVVITGFAMTLGVETEAQPVKLCLAAT